MSGEWEGQAVRRSMLRSSASLGAALLIAASVSGGVLAAPSSHVGTAAAHRTTTSGQAARNRLLSGLKLTHRTGETRHSVDVRQLASRKPTVRPTKGLPYLGRGASWSRPPTSGGPKTTVLAPPAPTPATTNADGPAAQTSFDGLSDAVTNIDPPDPWVAVGPEHVVQAVNLTLRMTDRQGGSPLDVTLPDFFQLPGGPRPGPTTFDSDPHVIYDSLHRRWLATEVSWDCQPGGGSLYGTGYIDFAISRTADPTGIWDLGYVFYGDQLPDYPAPGTSTDKIGIGVNLFDMTGGPDCTAGLTFSGTDTVYMDWTDLLNGGGFDIMDLGLDATTFTPRVAVQAPATSSALHQIFGYDDGLGGLGIVYLTVVGSVVTGLAVDAAWDLTTDNLLASNQSPPQPTQPGPDTIASAIDLRVTDAIWEGDRFAFVSTYPCGTGPRDCVRVSELDTTGASASVEPTVTQDFLVSESGKNLFMGGVGLSGDGTLHVGWTRSSSTDNPSSYAAHQAAGDALNSISAPELLAAGTAAYGGERWGDYVGVAQDPQVPSQAWNGNQYSGGTEWLTKITPLRTAGTTYVPITPVRVLNTRSAVGLSGMFSANKARTWPVAGQFGIPDGAVAVTGNVTVTGQTASGFVAITVDPTNNPPTSSINFPKGQTRANNVTIPLSSSGTLSATYGAVSGNKTHVLFDVTGYFLADDSGATFTPLTPVRVISTRTGVGLSGKFHAGSPRTLVVAGSSGVPLTATAITGNLTVVGPTKAGYVAITKDPVASPSTSTLNFPAGVTSRANGFFAPLSATGAVSIVYNVGSGTASADMIMDITGYFESGTGGLRFVPLNPSRIMNTRPTAVLSGLGGKFHANTPRTLDVDGHWGVPTGAAAITANLTVTAQTGSGFVAVTPDPVVAPATSTINFPVGDTMANGLVGPLNGTGNCSLTYVSGAGKTTDLLLDLSGYFE